MTALPYMPLFVNDYLGDTEHLTTVEHGAYLLLIFNYWRCEGPIPADDKKLAAIARMPLDQWLEIKPSIEEFFTSKPNGDANAMRWHHARIDHELRLVHAKSSKARASANARWNKDNNANAERPQYVRNATIQDNKQKARGRARIFVEKGTKEWTAWQAVKPQPPMRADDGRQGWWYPSLLPELDKVEGEA